ncbi:MAG: hypothetical protein EOO47_06285 [Flavobacterium sp.]|nr:MAG: hypothetical protein EOO47_06285 [Flavobacterium sp.]
MKYFLDFYTQYSQFYLVDKSSDQNTSDDFWDEDAFEDRLAINDGILGVGTECYGPIKGEVEILEKENSNIDFSDYDHIVEASLQINSGALQIQDCPNSSIQLEVILPENCYSVRIYSSNLASVEGDEGDDYYRIEIWPAPPIRRKVLKRFI